MELENNIEYKEDLNNKNINENINISNIDNVDKINDNDSDSKDSMCSIDSIVSKNNIDLNSGDEAPEDFIYLKEKIIKRYVIKTILNPGKFYDRPSKSDLIEYEFICFFSSQDSYNINCFKTLFQINENQSFYEELNKLDFVYKTKGAIKEFLHIESRLHINEAIKKSLFRMRKGEISLIECNKKYTYDCIDPINKDDKYLDNFNMNYFNRQVLKDFDLFNFSENYFEIEGKNIKKSFIEKFKKKKLLYVFKLNDYTHYYDLLDNGRVMKTIIENGVGITSPFNTDLIDFDVELRIGKYQTSIKSYRNVELEDLDFIEKRIINSMKKKEKSFIEIFYTEGVKSIETYFAKNSNTCIILDLVKEAINDKENFDLLTIEEINLVKSELNTSLNIIENLFKQFRIFYIITLNNFKEPLYKKEIIKNQTIYKRNIAKGIGSSIGYDNFYAFLLIKIEKSIIFKDELEVKKSNNSKSEEINHLCGKETDFTVLFSNYDNSINKTSLENNNLLEDIYNDNNNNSDIEITKDNFFSLENLNKLKSDLIKENISSNSLLNFNAYKLLMKSFSKHFKALHEENPYNLEYTHKLNNSMGKLIYYDSITNLLPEFITKNIIKMSLYETIELKTISKIDYAKLNDFEIIDSELSEYKITISLLNFYENKFIFDSNENENECIAKIDNYREISNYFNKNNLKEKADKMNNYIVTETIKHYNLLIKGVDSEISLKCKKLHSPLSKIHSNYILSLFKSNNLRDTLQYVEWFFKLYDKNEILNDNNLTFFKVKLIEIKSNESLFNFEKCTNILSDVENDIKNLNLTNKNTYDNMIKTIEEEKVNIYKKLEESDKKRSSLIKKMFK